MMKEKLTTEQYWKMMALQAMTREAQRAVELAQEAAGHLHTRLGIAQRASDQATQKRAAMKTVLKAGFIRLGHDLGATGSPDTWKIHLEDNPKGSTLEWKDEAEKDTPENPVPEEGKPTLP
jgi:hypothetical protein